MAIRRSLSGVRALMTRTQPQASAMPRSKLALLVPVLSCLLAPAAHAQPPIAAKPPAFRIYDVDRRERDMRHTLDHLAGTPALDRRDADAALAELDDIGRMERHRRAQAGGRLTVPIIRAVDTRLNALSHRIGLREPTY
jgi:hypothetical protein